MFDEYQNDAIFSNEDKILLVASPGSGKTTVIVQRLNNLINSGINGENILLITFTRKACENMRNRFLSKNSSSTLPYFYTFHSLFYKIIKDNVNSNIEIITDKLFEEFVTYILKKYTDVITDYKIQSIMCEITRFNKSNQRIEEFETDFPKGILNNISNEYIKFKKDRNILDFDDLANEVIKLFNNRQDILGLYRKKFKYILVDEFQDCDNVQFEILKLLSTNSKLFCVGDEDQSIYKFRGANPSIMVNFCNVFSDAKVYYLKYNYRSNNSIINFSRNVIKNNKIRNEKQLVGRKIEEGEVICKKFVEDIEQGSYIVNDIESVLENGGDLSDFAVLYRNHNDSFSVLSEFIKRNIKINFLDGSFNIFEQFYIKDIINLLLFIDNPSIVNFKNIYNKITFLFSRRVIQSLNKFDYNLNVFNVVKYEFDKFSYNDKRSLYNLEKIINKFKKYPIDSRINGILNKLGYSTYLDNMISQKKLNRNDIDYFMQYFHNVIVKFKSINEFYGSIKSINSVDGVNFGTIHSAKGMEFRCVYIINAQKMTKDLISNSINVFYDEEEERRIFYVGITRAIESLKILSPYFINGKFISEPLKFVGEGLLNNEYGKVNNDEIKKISKNKVLLYTHGKKKQIDTKDYLNIT